MSTTTTSCQRMVSTTCLLILSATLLMVSGQQQQNGVGGRSTFLRSMSQVRPVATTTSTIRPEEVDRTSDLETRPSLTIQPEDRLKLRQSVMDLTKRRRVTAIRPTMSPDVISTPNVYHFFSKKRFDRVRLNSTKTTSESPTASTATEPSTPAVTLAA